MYKMMPSRPTCVSWLVLASYVVLLGIGGVGVWVSVNNFWEEEPLPPTPPPDLEAANVTTTTTTPNPYDYSRHEKRVPEAYKEYIYKTHYFARATSDARLYVMLPCVVSIVVAAMVLVAGLWSRQFFSYTFSMYSSVCLWALTLTWTLVYQDEVAYSRYSNMDFVCWVLAFHVVLLLLLSAQILFGMWELRRQKAGWPTINCRSLITVEAILVTARMTLTVFTLIFMSGSQLLRGYDGQKDPHYENFWETPSIRCPLVFTILAYSAACYNAVATSETVLSMLLGKLHTYMTTVSSLLSALCCVTTAVVCSPVVMKVINPSYRIYPEPMFFAIALSVVTFLHVVACVGFPITSRSLPTSITKIFDLLASSVSSLGNTIARERLQSALTPRKEKSYLFFNLISTMFSTVSIIVVAVVWDSPLYRSWGFIMVMGANFATLVRTLPAFVADFLFKEEDNTSVNQRLMAMTLECLVLLVGAIGICARSWYGGEIFAGVANLLFFVFQIYIIVPLVKEKCRARVAEEVERLSNTEEVSTEDKDDEQNTNDLMA